MLGFNSLFIGIGSAIRKYPNRDVERHRMFQFPFHRDRLCNEAEGITIGEIQAGFQFPFHRDRLCNTQNMLAGAWVTLTRFNSLFIGIGSAMPDLITMAIGLVMFPMENQKKSNARG